MEEGFGLPSYLVGSRKGGKDGNENIEKRKGTRKGAQKYRSVKITVVLARLRVVVPGLLTLYTPLALSPGINRTARNGRNLGINKMHDGRVRLRLGRSKAAAARESPGLGTDGL